MSKQPQPVTFNVIWPACIQCGACVAVCLQREPFISPFDTIAVDTPCHIACMHCLQVCPTSAITYQVLGPVSRPGVTRRGTTVPCVVQENRPE
jgi:NAD-dependent dihydropyrimidine dehydrogenase PreA subunit